MFKPPNVQQVLPTEVKLSAMPQYSSDINVQDIPLYDIHGNILYLIPGTIQKVVNLLHDGKLFTLQDGKYTESEIYRY